MVVYEFVNVGKDCAFGNVFHILCFHCSNVSYRMVSGLSGPRHMIYFNFLGLDSFLSAIFFVSLVYTK